MKAPDGCSLSQRERVRVREKLAREVISIMAPGGGYVAGPATISFWKRRLWNMSWPCLMRCRSLGFIRLEDEAVLDKVVPRDSL